MGIYGLFVFRPKKGSFWSVVRKLNQSSSSPCATVVDGVSGNTEIANLMASKLCALLNTHSPLLCDSLLNSIQTTKISLKLNSVQ